MVVRPQRDGRARIALRRLEVTAAQCDVAEPREALGAFTCGGCTGIASGAPEQLERPPEPALGLVDLVPVERDQPQRELRVVVLGERGGVLLEGGACAREVAEVVAAPAEVLGRDRPTKNAARRSAGSAVDQPRAASSASGKSPARRAARTRSSAAEGGTCAAHAPPEIQETRTAATALLRLEDIGNRGTSATEPDSRPGLRTFGWRWGRGGLD